jgi:hypothetical protein
MAQSESCEGCSHAHSCSNVYEQLGCAKGPSIAWTAVLAFLTPILVFIGTLAGFGRLLEGAADARYQMPLATAMALAATTGVMLVVRGLTRRHRRK